MSKIQGFCRFEYLDRHRFMEVFEEAMRLELIEVAACRLLFKVQLCAFVNEFPEFLGLVFGKVGPKGVQEPHCLIFESLLTQALKLLLVVGSLQGHVCVECGRGSVAGT